LDKARWLLLLCLMVTVLVYLPGLDGPFLFDDAAHVSKNKQVHITDLSPESLARAWDSSHAHGLAKRPLAQLSFGINHALGGLDAWQFKATNLGIHLLSGLLVFALARQLTRSLNSGHCRNEKPDTPWPALLLAALWLLHPINLTPVLYVVQRMTSLSSLFVLFGLWLHVSGRLAMARGDCKGFWLALAGLPVAALGGLAKESAALYPLLVLVLEWTLLRDLKAPRRGQLLAIVAVIPISLGLAYLATHLGLLEYGKREFTLEQRLMTEARVLWLYLRMLAWPDLSLLGLYHDDVTISTGLLSPWTTLPAVLGWLLLSALAILQARRWPVASFAVLFFLASHVLESTILPLELVFEHRNYLAILGPMFAITWLLSSQTRSQWRTLLIPTTVSLLVALAAITHLRALDWSGNDRLVLSEVRHHPESPRANFRTAQLLMDQLGKTEDPSKVYHAARHHLEQVRRLDPANNNPLFGLAYLELIIDRDPAPEIVNTLIYQLRHGFVGPTKLAIAQFPYLVRWQLAKGNRKFPHQQALAILTAALENPRMSSQGKAAVLSATRAYHDRVLHDLPAALPYARQAVRIWPKRWHYHYRLVQLLIRLGQWQEAQAAFDVALVQSSAALHADQRAELADALQNHSTENLRIHD